MEEGREPKGFAGFKLLDLWGVSFIVESFVKSNQKIVGPVDEVFLGANNMRYKANWLVK